jgi:hypothetical protein
LKKSQRGDESWGQIIGDNYIIPIFLSALVPRVPLHQNIKGRSSFIICSSQPTNNIKTFGSFSLKVIKP